MKITSKFSRIIWFCLQPLCVRVIRWPYFLFSLCSCLCRVCCLYIVCACVENRHIGIHSAKDTRARELVRWQCCYCSPKLAVESWDGYCHWIKYTPTSKESWTRVCVFFLFDLLIICLLYIIKYTIDDSKIKTQTLPAQPSDKHRAKRKVWTTEKKEWNRILLLCVLFCGFSFAVSPHSNLISSRNKGALELLLPLLLLIQSEKGILSFGGILKMAEVRIDNTFFLLLLWIHII